MAAQIQYVGPLDNSKPFDAEGSGYDYESAKAAGISPDSTGHWPSRDPESGLLLKGRKHETWSKTIEGEEKSGYEIYKQGNRYYSRKKGGVEYLGPLEGSEQPQPTIAPFNFQSHLDEHTKNMPPKEATTFRENVASVLGELARPWVNLGYGTMQGLNRGSAQFYHDLSLLGKFLESHKMGKGGTPNFDAAAKSLNENADYWKDKADKNGVQWLQEFMGQSIGATVPGMTDFILKLKSGLTIPAAVGAEQAKEEGRDPTIGAIVDAGKVGVMGWLFKLVEPFNSYMRSTVLGSTMGAEAAVEAPKGQKTKAFVQGAIQGVAFGVRSKGGNTITDLFSEVKVPDFVKAEMKRSQVERQKEQVLRPALKMGEGEAEAIAGNPGETHNDVISRESQNVSRETGRGLGSEAKPEGPAKPMATISDRARQVQASPTASAVQDSWTLTSPQGGSMEVTFSDTSVRVDQVRGTGGGDASALYERLGQMMKDRGIPGKNIEGDIEAEKPEQILHLREKAAAIAGEEGEGDRYDIDIQESGEFTDIEWAKEMAPDMIEEAQRRTETRMKGEEPQGLQQMESRDLQISFDLGSAGRGFVGPDGKFMDREQAKQWVKENQPEVYDRWMALTGNEAAEFHSQDYAEAAGISTQPISGIPNDPDIGHLTHILKTMPKETGLKQRIRAAEKAATTHTGPLAKAQNACGKIKAVGSALSDYYHNPPSDSPFDILFSRYLGSRQISGMKTEQWAKEIQDTIPRDRQEAITKWIRANGDMEELQRRALESTDPKFQKRYADALTLTPDELKLAQNVRAYYDRMLDRAIQAGVLETGITDYVNRVYKTRPKAIKENGDRLASQANAGMLQKNPSFAKKRFYEHDWEAEQAGGELEDRIGYLIAIYQKSFDEAIAAREFMASLAQGKATDGRPLVAMRGSGHQLPGGEEPPQAYVISPRARPKPREFRYTGKEEAYPSETNLGDYRNIDHPALRGHKWVGQDADGNPIFLDADMIVHPEAFKRLKNALVRSKIPEIEVAGIPVGKALLRGSGEIKGTILGFFSSFHQVHLAQHALTHGITPWNPPDINFENPRHVEMLEHGLKLYDGDALNEFMEGVQGPGLIKYIPKVGEWAQSYTDYLFKAPTGYIPRLKMKLALELFDRNLARYKNLSRDQVLFLSARQADAAMGGINYKLMGRNPTFQDLLRLGGLAPDFLEARMRFFGQSFKPYGKEQFTAMAIRGSIGMYVAAKVIEGIGVLVDPDKNKLHLDEPFSTTLWGKSYSIRSVQGDLVHAWSDPRGFIYNRLNPAIVRPAIEALTGRDQFGRVKDAEAQIKDYAKGSLPIAGQGFFTRRDFNLYQSILQSMGISSWDYRTEAQTMMRKLQMEKSQAPAADETRERRQTRVQLTEDLAKDQDPAPIRKALAEKKITPKDVIKIFTTAFEGDLATGMKGLTLPESLKIWKAANDEEKALIQKSIVGKWIGWDATETEREAFQSKMDEILEWRAKEPASSRFSILKRK